MYLADAPTKIAAARENAKAFEGLLDAAKAAKGFEPMAQTLLSTRELVKNLGSRTLLDHITLGLSAGERLGLIGDNGTGKSTLLKLLAGHIPADGGSISYRNGLRVGFLAQVPALPTGSIQQALLAPLAPLIAAIEAYEKNPNDPQAATYLADIERLGGWDYQHRLARAASSLGIDDLTKSTAKLSGGYQKRVALAAMLLSNPELVLLDEPTNHLDLETVAWLEQWLAKNQVTAVVVTHDRMFLDKVVDRMGELRDGQLRIYPGNYADYLAARATEEALSAQTTARRRRILAHELEWASRSPQARTTKSRARLDRIEAAQASLKAAAPQEISAEQMALGAPVRLGKTIVEMHDVTVAHTAGKTLFEPFSFIMTPKERWGIIGPNGAGKTSLLRLITQALQPVAGTVTLGLNTRIAYFDQHREALDPKASLRETLLPQGGDTVYPDGQPMHVAAWLGRFAFAPERHQMRVGQLSGGERNRLALAKFMLASANLLLMDEPTNDLDLTTLGVLETALAEYSGCVMVVSHDRAFLDRLTTGIIAFEPSARGAAHPYTLRTVQGNYSHYEQQRVLAGAQDTSDTQQTHATQTSKKATQARPTAPPKPLSFKERRSLAQAEAQIETLEAHIAELQTKLQDPAVWSTDQGAQGQAHTTSLANAQAQLAEVYTLWEQLQGKQDAADAAKTRPAS